MSTKILASGTSKGGAPQSSIERAAQAAEECITRAKIDVGSVDVLINIGVYRDENTVEPSIAALIQQRLGMNLDFVKNQQTSRKTFSFDLMNGACGMVNAVQVGGAMIDSGHAELVLIVSSDTHPAIIEPEDFPYANVGGAMLLARSSDPARGFLPCVFDLDHVGDVGREGFSEMTGKPLMPGATSSRLKITLRTDSVYEAKKRAFLAKTIKAYASAHSVDLSKSLLLTSQCQGSFGADVAEELGLARDAALRIDGLERDPYTSSLTFAYDAAIARGLGERYEHMIFAAAGSGISVACAAYKPEVKKK